MRINLIGMPGSGKTTIGLKLSQTLNLEHIDLDKYIEYTNNISIEDYINNYGIEEFRSIESIALKSLSDFKGILSTGGGIIEKEMNHLYLKDTNIYLYTTIDTLNSRNLSGRPLLATSSIDSLYQRRTPIYERLSTFIVDNNFTIEKCISDILDILPRGIYENISD